MKLVKAIVSIKRSEFLLALMMFLYFFLVIAAFWILKPLKKGLFIEYYDKDGLWLLGTYLRAAQVELLAKVANVIIAFAAMGAFSILSGRYKRARLTVVLIVFLMIGTCGFGGLLLEIGTFGVWSFYLFGDLFVMLLVSAFFAFLNDSVSPKQAKRLYGFVVLGGVLGGVFGSTFVRVWLGQSHIWIALGFVLFCLGAIVIVAVVAGRIVKKDFVDSSQETSSEEEEKTMGLVFQGMKIAIRSRYLLSIVSIVGLYEIASTLADYQFTEAVSHYVDDGAIRKYFSSVYLVTNCVSMLVQLFATSFVMTRFGVGKALLVLPVALAMGAAGFFVLPVLWIGSFLSVTDNGLNYSINQSAKEALYVPTGVAEKYRAKAFIDIFVQRFAKAVAIGIGLLLSMLFDDFQGVRWLSLVTLSVVVLWIFAASRAGRKFNCLASGQLKKEPTNGC